MLEHTSNKLFLENEVLNSDEMVNLSAANVVVKFFFKF